VEACEGYTLEASCPDGYAIYVLNGLFGRDGLVPQCYADPGPLRWNNLNCSSINGLTEIRRQCHKKNSCSVSSNINTFGDPCPGTRKFTRMNYFCMSSSDFLEGWQLRRNCSISSPAIVTTCEDESRNLTCGRGEVIKIDVADYGRTQPYPLCGLLFDNSDFAKTSSCRSTDTTTVALQRLCDGQNYCTFNASNDQFGDPCPGIRKYSEVQYSCIAGTTGSICEGETVNITCPGSYIRIQDAVFGRLKPYPLCGASDPASWTVNSTTCESPGSLTEVRNRCQWKETCEVPAVVEAFGDPCPGQIKYLEYTYVCGS